MFFLAGLLGMMALGSVVVVSTTMPEDEVSDEDDHTQESTTAEADSQTGSLFEQMGLIESGSEGDDTMAGSDNTDVLIGMDGDDVIEGGGEDDELHGNDGTDTVLGGGDDDTIHGEDGDDLLDGGDDDDDLYGHHGDDAMQGGDGDDHLVGGLGNDIMDGGIGDDALGGREGEDTLHGGLGSDTLFGGFDNDLVNGVVRGETGEDIDDQDFLNGGDGDDTIAAGSGDIVTAGEGADTFVLGDWLTGDAAQFMDYDNSEDQLVIVYDDSMGDEDPELDIRVSAENPDMTEVVVDGAVLATMASENAPSIDSVVLVGESMADELAVA